MDELNFKALTRSNVYSLHNVIFKGSPLIMVITIDGALHSYRLSVSNLCFSPLHSNLSFPNLSPNSELVSMEIGEIDNDDTIVIVTGAVDCDMFGNVNTHTIHTFTYNMEGLNTAGVYSTVGVTSLVKFVPTSVINDLTLLAFNSKKTVACFGCQIPSCTLIEVRVEEILPELRGILPGLVINMECSLYKDKRWTLIGCDTGHVIVTVTSVTDGNLLMRSEFKLDTPISVLRLLGENKCEENLRILIGGALAPATIWYCRIGGNAKLKWAKDLELENSHKHDCVIGGNWNYWDRDNGEVIVMLGTFGEKLLLYNISNQSNINWSKSIDFPSPVVGARLVSAENDRLLVVLTWNGIHLCRIKFDT